MKCGSVTQKKLIRPFPLCKFLEFLTDGFVTILHPIIIKLYLRQYKNRLQNIIKNEIQ